MSITFNPIAAIKLRNDLLEEAWGIIANAYQSDWSLALPEWKKVAEEWREKYFEILPSSDQPDPTQDGNHTL